MLCLKLLLWHRFGNKCTYFRAGDPSRRQNVPWLCWPEFDSLCLTLYIYHRFLTFTPFTLFCVLAFCLLAHLVLFCLTPLGVCLTSLIAHLRRSPGLNPEPTEEEVARAHGPFESLMAGCVLWFTLQANSTSKSWVANKQKHSLCHQNWL